MDWTMLADALDVLIYIGCAIFLVYGAALSISSVLPEKPVRRTPRAARFPEPTTDAITIG